MSDYDYASQMKQIQAQNAQTISQYFSKLPTTTKSSTNSEYSGIIDNLQDYGLIRKGSYKKLMKAYYKKMEEKGWKFKADEEGNSLGKGAGVAIEFFELRDKETEKPFDRKTLDGRTKTEQEEYMNDNVYPVRKYYRVFNADIIDGIPEREKRVVDPIWNILYGHIRTKVKRY